MWIVRVALNRPYTFIVLTLLILLISPLVIQTNAHRYFPQRQYPGGRRAVELHRPERRGDGGAHHHGFERNLTTTVNDMEHIESQTVNGREHHQDLLPSQREDRDGGGADDRAGRIRRPPDAAGHHAAVHPGLQRVERAHHAARAFRQRAVRAAACSTSPPTTSEHPLATVQGAAIPYPYGGKQRQVMIDIRPGSAAGQGTVARRRGERGQCAESDSAGGNLENRAVRIRRRSEQQPGARGGDSTTCRSRPSTTPPSISTMWRMFATAFRRKPTSCGATAHRGVLMTIMKVGQTSTLDIVKQVRDALPAIAAQRSRRS